MILVCGEALIDLTPTSTEVDLQYQPCPGGGPFNVAVGLGRLGVPVGFFGRVSTDAFGRLLAQRLADAGVDERWVLRGREPTPLAVVTPGLPGHENEFQFYVEGTAHRAIVAGDLPDDLGRVTALHVGTLGLALEPVATSLELLVTREAPRRVVGLDPNIRPALVADGAAYRARLARLAAMADLVKVSDADAAWLDPRGDSLALVERWLGAGAGLVVMTRGADGAEAWSTGGSHARVPAPTVAVVDTVGAGDAFNAGLLTWLHDRGSLAKDSLRALGARDLEQALEFAADIAARTCQRAGADPPWRAELV